MHELTDSDKRLALLQLDITNAFNTCDRARLLSELYGQADLQSLYRITDLAYSQPRRPRTEWVQRTDG